MVQLYVSPRVSFRRAAPPPAVRIILTVPAATITLEDGESACVLLRGTDIYLIYCQGGKWTGNDLILLR